jgi:hypothetical protein
MTLLHLSLLAYWIVNTVLRQLKKEVIRSGWREIVRTMDILSRYNFSPTKLFF